MTSRHPRVSIGLPVYNGEDYLREAIDSILAQTFSDFELLISDNGSTDATEAICREYAARDCRIRYLRQAQNLGATKNYNLLFPLARGAYYKWMGHDDIILPEYLARCVAVLDAHPEVVIAFPQAVFIDANGEILGYDREFLDLRIDKPGLRFLTYLKTARGWINPVFGLMRASVLRETPLYLNFSSSDMILLGEMALRGQFYFIDEPLFLRRDHPKGSVQANRDPRDRQVWFDPKNRGRIELTRWRWFFGYLWVVSRVPLCWTDRLTCYAPLVKWLKGHRREMVADLKLAARSVAQGNMRFF
jgi:glycosyltransferase involved in cell wall biosynthesis